MARELPAALKDGEATYFDKESAMHPGAFSWEDWKRKLKSRYLDFSKKFTAREGFGKSHFSAKEPMEQYYDDILELIMDADPELDSDMQVHDLLSELRMVPLM